MFVSICCCKQNYENIGQYSSKHLRLNIIRTICASMTLTYILEVPNLIFYISKTVRASANMCARHLCILTFIIEWCHCENCTSWPWSTFWRSKLLNVNISEKVRASAKMHGTTFKDLDICRWMIPLRQLHAVILSYYFKVQKMKL